MAWEPVCVGSQPGLQAGPNPCLVGCPGQRWGLAESRAVGVYVAWETSFCPSLLFLPHRLLLGALVEPPGKPCGPGLFGALFGAIYYQPFLTPAWKVGNITSIVQTSKPYSQKGEGLRNT